MTQPASKRVVMESTLPPLLEGKADNPGAARSALTGDFHASGFGLSSSAAAAVNTTALTNAIAAMNAGDTLRLPAGRFQVTALPSITKAIQIVGSGASLSNQQPYGDTSWTTGTGQSGTVLVSTSTSGAVIDVDKVAGANGVRLENFALIGPGTGTSTGLRLGPSGGIGYPVRVRLSNVSVANFAKGVEASCENSTLHGLYVIGCGVGVSTYYPFNGNAVTGLDIERCATTALDLTASDTNAFVGGVIQGNYGTSVRLSNNCYGNTFTSIYLENFGPGSGFDELSIADSQFNTFDRCHFGSASSAGPRITLGSGAIRNLIRVQGLSTANVPYAVNLDANSSRNRVVGRLTGTVTDAGASNIVELLGDEAVTYAPVGQSTPALSVNVDPAHQLLVLTGGGQAAHLPDPTTVTRGRVYRVKNAGAATNNTVDSLGSGRTIDGAASVGLAAWQARAFVSDGAQWLTI